MELPVLATVPADLVPDAAVTRSGGSEDLPARGRLRIGLPVGVALDGSTVTDAELRTFITAENSTARYVLFHFSMTLDRDDDWPVRRAWLGVTLARADSAAPPPVIAWSLSPLRETRDTSTSTRSIQVGPALKLLSANFTAQTTTTRQQVVVEGTGLQESTPSWELTPASGDALSGSYQFALVARGPSGDPMMATVSVMASVYRRRALRAYHAELPTGSPVSIIV